MTESPHVALFLPALRAGGAERVAVNVANGLAERGQTVDLVLSNEQGQFRDQVDARVTVVDLETLSVPVAGVGAGVLRLKAYLDRNCPDVLFSSMTHANLVALVASWLSRAESTVVVIEHERFDLDRSGVDAFVSFVAKYAYRTADRTVAVSTGVGESIVEQAAVDRERVSVLHNPVDVDEIRHRSRVAVEDPWLASDDVHVVFTAARLERAKDIPTLLNAFSLVHERRPDTRLIVAGAGEREDDLRSLSEQIGICDVVSFPGYVDNPYAYMRRADVFALSSRHEGLPTVLVEALVCGCPIVATDCPSGPREILADGEYGKLVSVGDPGAFADAVLSTIEAPPDPDRLRERGEEFSMDVVIDRYARLVDCHCD